MRLDVCVPLGVKVWDKVSVCDPVAVPVDEPLCDNEGACDELDETV